MVGSQSILAVGSQFILIDSTTQMQFAQTLTPKSKPRFFISYRRKLEADSAARVAGILVGLYGEDYVYLDIWNFPEGNPTRETLRQQISTVDIVIAIIGEGWTSRQPDLHDETDIVRLELTTALSEGCLIVPLFVQGAAKPKRENLPDCLACLVDLGGIELSHVDFETVFKARIRRVVKDWRSRQRGSIASRRQSLVPIFLVVGLFLTVGLTYVGRVSKQVDPFKGFKHPIDTGNISEHEIPALDFSENDPGSRSPNEVGPGGSIHSLANSVDCPQVNEIAQFCKGQGMRVTFGGRKFVLLHPAQKFHGFYISEDEKYFMARVTITEKRITIFWINPVANRVIGTEFDRCGFTLSDKPLEDIDPTETITAVEHHECIARDMTF